MTDKELLLKDLCARLPYGVMIHIEETNESEELYCLNIPQEGLYTRNKEHHNISSLCPIEQAKPYLRPPSSMTEEERNEYKYLVAFSGNPNGSANFTDWLNKKMFAYRTINGKDMFELGLALEAPEGMYKHFGDMDVVITSVEHKDKL